MGSEFSAAAVLVGKDQLSRPWNKALKSAERQAGRSFNRIERAGLRATRAVNKGFRAAGRGVRVMGGAARKATGIVSRVGVGLAAVGAGAVDQFGKYEIAVARLGNILGTKTDVVAEYGGALRNLATNLGISLTEAAEGAYAALSGGVERNKTALLGFLESAGKASVAGAVPLATAVKVATGAMEVFGKEAGGVDQIFNKLFVAEREGVTTFGELADSMGDLTSFAKASGLSLNEVLAPVASLTKTGLATGSAMTQLGAILTGVTNASGKFKGGFKKFKIPFGPNAIKEAGGFIPLIEKIGAVAKKNPGAIQKMFGRKEAIKGLSRLTESGLGSLKTTMDGLKTDTRVFQDNFDNIEKRTGFRIRQMKAGISGLVGSLGSGLAKGFGLAGGGAGKMAGRFKKASTVVEKSGASFAESFLEGLTPGRKLADIDWAKFASNAGSAFGKFVNILGTMVKAAVSAWTLVSDLISGDNDQKRALKKVGVSSTTSGGDALADQIKAQKADIKKRTFAGGPGDFSANLAKAEGGGRLANLRRLETLQAQRRLLGRGNFSTFAKSEAGRAAGAGEFAGSAQAEEVRRLRKAGIAFQASPEGSRQTLQKKIARLRRSDGTAASSQTLEGLIRLEVSLPEGVTAKTTATTKNKGVKIKAGKTGKRKVAQ